MRALLAIVLLAAFAAHAQPPRTGAAAFGDWRDDAPGVTRHITPDSLPVPYETRSVSRAPSVIARPAGAVPHVPPGFTATLFASGLDMPRTMRVAPNGDVFLAESGSGRILVFHGREKSVFASRLSLPFGIAFWPPGPAPSFVYVAETDRIVRFAYHAGDTNASGRPRVVVRELPQGGHWTRDLAFSPDGRRMFVSVGSDANIASELQEPPPTGLPLGAAWGDERDRAAVLSFDPDGTDKHLFATGLRNCSAEAIQPGTGALWCVVNERDGFGDDLPPDFATSVREGAFYGWPWFYIGAHQNPRLAHARADLAGHVTLPDVLIQPHSAPLGVAFYDATEFPADYRGDAFVALHGSWNRAKRTGYKVIRLRFDHARPTGVYEDFLTGFVASDQAVWARPVGVAVTSDGALLVSEDANGTIWRVEYQGNHQ